MKTHTKTMTKVLLGGAALAGAAAASHAQIPIPLPSTDASELLFFVNSYGGSNAGDTYTVALSQVVGNGTGSYFNSTDAMNSTAVKGTTIGTIYGDGGFTYTFTGDTALSSFISNASGNLQWGLIGGAYPGSTETLPDYTRGDSLVVSTGTSTSILTLSNNEIGDSIPTGYESDVGKLTAQTYDSFNGTTNGVFCTSGSAGDANCDLYASGITAAAALGTAQSLYGATGNGGTSNTGKGYEYLLGSATFNGTSLVFTGETVPLPAAAWLFGSGLLGLLGIARRRGRGAIETA
jgi:hypothetical protein